MRIWFRRFGVVAAVGAVIVAAAPVHAARLGAVSSNVVFVQTNDPAGNSIDVFNRNADGTLTFVKSYATGGNGGRESGAMSDALASQGSLVLLPKEGLLLAVNAGSNTISVFETSGAKLHLEKVLPSGGSFPVGFGVDDPLVYVLNAGGSGTVSGFRVTDGSLHPIAGSARTLGLANSIPPFFLSSPAEVGFSPSGSQLLVTTKTNGTVDVFSVGNDGRLSAAPVKNAEAGVPFSFVFGGDGKLILNFAGTSSLETFTLNPGGTIDPAGAAVSDGQVAACWTTPAAGFEYVSNTGSNDVSQFHVSGGVVTLVNPVAATNIPGAIDSSRAGGFLYVQSGLSSAVYVFAIGGGGSLTQIQIASVPGGGSQEGIAIG